MKNSYANDFTDSVKAYFKDIKDCNPLSREDEEKLFIKARENDPVARDKILTSNLKFVFDVAKKYKGYGVSMDDLISEGNLGLLYAYDKFDNKKGVKFISYAVWWIRWYIQDFILRASKRNDIETSDNDEYMTLKVNKIGVNDIEDETLEMKDVIMSNSSDIEDNERYSKEKETINKLLSKLDEREQSIIKFCYGLDGDKAMTLEECSKAIGMSRERVRQLKAKSLLKMKSEMLLLA